MAGLNRMTGTVWHIERFERAEGDERRHRARCRYYQGKPDGLCSFYDGKCRGSAHCMKYEEKDTTAKSDMNKTVVARKVPTEHLSQEEIEKRNALRKIGVRVWIKKYNAVGYVVNYTASRVTVRCDDGREGTYDIELALKHGSIRVV